MGIVLRFPLERVQRRTKGNGSQETAKILVFEGVQYQKSECGVDGTAKVKAVGLAAVSDIKD